MGRNMAVQSAGLNTVNDMIKCLIVYKPIMTLLICNYIPLRITNFMPSMSFSSTG